jgi:hypothetical protein
LVEIEYIPEERHLSSRIPDEYAEHLVRGYEIAPDNFTRIGSDIKPETYEK